MGSMLIALGLYIVGIVIMGAVVFYVGKQVLEILSQPVAKIIGYLIGYASKQIPQVKDNVIPIIVGVAGGVLGIVDRKSVV